MEQNNDSMEEIESLDIDYVYDTMRDNKALEQFEKLMEQKQQWRYNTHNSMKQIKILMITW